MWKSYRLHANVQSIPRVHALYCVYIARVRLHLSMCMQTELRLIIHLIAAVLYARAAGSVRHPSPGYNIVIQYIYPILIELYIAVILKYCVNSEFINYYLSLTGLTLAANHTEGKQHNSCTHSSFSPHHLHWQTLFQLSSCCSFPTSRLTPDFKFSLKPWYSRKF